MKYVFFTLTLAFVSACATSYAPNTFWNDGGFTETEIQPGVFQVRFKGNEFTQEERAADFAMLRAAEICLERDNSHIIIGDMNVVTKATAQLPGTATTTTSVYGSGNSAYGSSTTTVTPPTTLYSPESGLIVACLPEQSDDAWDAAFLARALKTKYKLE